MIKGNDLTYTREMEAGKQIYAVLTGYGSTENDNQFVIENRKTGAAVRARIDRPMDMIRYWSPRTTLCPEPFINLSIKPKQADRWSIHYTFYTVGEGR